MFWHFLGPLGPPGPPGRSPDPPENFVDIFLKQWFFGAPHGLGTRKIALKFSKNICV